MSTAPNVEPGIQSVSVSDDFTSAQLFDGRRLVCLWPGHGACPRQLLISAHDSRSSAVLLAYTGPASTKTLVWRACFTGFRLDVREACRVVSYCPTPGS